MPKQTEPLSRNQNVARQLAVEYSKDEPSRPRKQKVQRLLFGKLGVQKHSSAALWLEFLVEWKGGRGSRQAPQQDKHFRLFPKWGESHSPVQSRMSHSQIYNFKRSSWQACGAWREEEARIKGGAEREVRRLLQWSKSKRGGDGLCYPVQSHSGDDKKYLASGKTWRWRQFICQRQSQIYNMRKLFEKKIIFYQFTKDLQHYLKTCH